MYVSHLGKVGIKQNGDFYMSPLYLFSSSPPFFPSPPFSSKASNIGGPLHTGTQTAPISSIQRTSRYPSAPNFLSSLPVSVPSPSHLSHLWRQPSLPAKVYTCFPLSPLVFFSSPISLSASLNEPFKDCQSSASPRIRRNMRVQRGGNDGGMVTDWFMGEAFGFSKQGEDRWTKPNVFHLDHYLKKTYRVTFRPFTCSPYHFLEHRFLGKGHFNPSSLLSQQCHFSGNYYCFFCCYK